MIVAVRALSVGEWVLAPGEKLTREMQRVLPPGRIKQMLEQGKLEEIIDEVAVTRATEDLAFRVEKLERTVAALSLTVEKSSTAKASTARKEAAS